MSFKNFLKALSVILLIASLYMIFFGKTFPTAEPYQQRLTVVLLIIGIIGAIFTIKDELDESE